MTRMMPDIRTMHDLERVVGNELLKKGFDSSNKDYDALRGRIMNLADSSPDLIPTYAEKVIDEYHRRAADQEATSVNRAAYAASVSRDR